jgi:predicted nucleic acid-binding Zn ribbon protein
MKCPKCGKEIVNDSAFCEYCGTKIKEDNPTKTDNTKRVDMRWALLLAMIIATIAMGIASESHKLIIWGYIDHSTEPTFIIPLCLFVASCWYAIRKSVPPSFIIVMGLLFSFNCLMLHDSFHTSDCYRYEMNVSWDDDENYNMGYGGVSLLSYYNYSLLDEGKAIKELEDMALALSDKLQKDGKKQCKVSSMYYDRRYYTKWDMWGAFVIALLITIMYLIYVFVANKKGWSF